MSDINHRDEEWLRDEYVGTDQSCRDLAEKAGVSRSAIQRALREYDIDAKDPNTYDDDARFKDEEWFREMYLVERWTLAEIAEACDATRSIVHYWKRKFDIPTPRMTKPGKETKIEELSDSQKAYLAGFIDADGSIGINKANNGETYNASLSIYNTHLETMEMMSEWLNETGRMCHREQEKDEWRDRYDLVWDSEFWVKEILDELLPYLSVKAEQAENALDLLKLKDERDEHQFNDRERERMRGLYERQRELNSGN